MGAFIADHQLLITILRLRSSLVICLLLASAVTLSLGCRTKVGFYSTSCPRFESIVQSVVTTQFNADPGIAPGLLRILFHDCFVRGCDASILITGPNTEETAPQNALLSGQEVINEAKAQLEQLCPGIVSCSDILNVATRDAVVLAGGSSWAVPTGRRDGNVSVASEAATLPDFGDSIPVQIQKFSEKGLNVQDLVALVGGHTIGTTACRFVRGRLYNYNSTAGASDPKIDPTFLPTLRSICPNDNSTRRAGMDHGSVREFDTSYFANLRDGRGVLESDQLLWTDDSTRPVVDRFLRRSGITFNVQFGRSMVKMSNIEVLTGTDGEIRRVCSAING